MLDGPFGGMAGERPRRREIVSDAFASLAHATPLHSPYLIPQ